ncbi:MAG: hypothetical protein E6J25_02160 [Chloroflexi bacterium]|nr:MAG: hypothetical protein E6J25_02160 [Chloroflexota bacterium]TME57177.1 MAG: hypothetical protein E6I60_02430 [Chloroflexota bacterium]
MVEPNGFSNNGSHRGRVHLLRRVAAWAGILLALGLAASASLAVSAGAANDGGHQVSGGGKTIIEGGGPGPVPVTTVLAFHANSQGGAFECLALMPPVATSFSPESGDFEVNAMYVTGHVTSVTVRDGTAVLYGTATVTGLGAGQNVAFTASVKAGGPGTTVTLTVSTLTFAFHEILLEGQITVH